MYIDFIIKDEAKFNDMKNVYSQLAEAKKTGDFKTEEFWLYIFPDYSLNKFYFNEGDLGPKNYTPDIPICRFVDMFNLIMFYFDVELNECKRIQQNGRIEFEALGFPYGTIGLNGLIKFLYAFDCKVFEIDQGGSIRAVYWIFDDVYIWDDKINSDTGSSERISILSEDRLLLYRPLTIAFDQVADAINRVGRVELIEREQNFIICKIRYKFRLIQISIALYNVENDKTYILTDTPDSLAQDPAIKNVTERLVQTIFNMDNPNYKPDRLGISLSSIIFWVLFFTGLIILIINIIT
jgi:hypothetical protein